MGSAYVLDLHLGWLSTTRNLVRISCVLRFYSHIQMRERNASNQIMVLCHVDVHACRGTIQWDLVVPCEQVFPLIEQVKYTPCNSLFLSYFLTKVQVKLLIIRSVSPERIADSGFAIDVEVFRPVEDILGLRIALDFEDQEMIRVES